MVAALAWRACDPLFKRAFGTTYADSELVGLAGHCAAGAAFGATFERAGLRGVRQGIAAAAVEGTVLWPGVGLFRRGVVTSPRAFGASLAGHVLFGALLGRLLAVPDYEA